MTQNPIIYSDYPDIDCIRVEDAYYMVSTTMFFCPTVTILRSYDLLHWEHAAYVSPTLDGTPAQKLEGGHIYSRGMWAASIRHHNGRFYIMHVCNDTGKTYVYTSTKIDGPWEKRTVEGFYHDPSILFDDDGRAYVVYGNTDIMIRELKPDLSAPLEGGLDRKLMTDEIPHGLGYEGSHFYKINGKYYLFLIHMAKGSPVSRQNGCYVSDSLTGEFKGGDCFADDMGYHRSGIAQGGIVDTPDGDYYMFSFQDRGGVGRVPFFFPFKFDENGLPVCGIDGKAPLYMDIPSTRPDYTYTPLNENGFLSSDGKLKLCWQFNHEPDPALYSFPTTDSYTVTTDRTVKNLHYAKNTLTQRTFGPHCTASVTVNASELNDGDIAGLAAFISCYGFIGVTKENGKLYLTMRSPDFTGGVSDPDKFHICAMGNFINDSEPEEYEKIPLDTDEVRLRMTCDFENGVDFAYFSYESNGETKLIGRPQKLIYRLDYFTGTRAALFLYSTKAFGGRAAFIDFKWE